MALSRQMLPASFSPATATWFAESFDAPTPAQSAAWEAMKIGGGAQMIETTRGWLQIYHGVDTDQRYSLGALLLDLPSGQRQRITAGDVFFPGPTPSSAPDPLPPQSD